MCRRRWTAAGKASKRESWFRSAKTKKKFVRAVRAAKRKQARS